VPTGRKKLVQLTRENGLLSLRAAAPPAKTAAPLAEKRFICKTCEGKRCIGKCRF